MVYVNLKNKGCSVETVDQFPLRREAIKAVKDFRLSDPTGNYYLSTRCTKDWREDS